MIVGEPAPVLVRPRKVQALFALLAVNRTVHSRTVLASMLWGDRDDVHARHSLNQCVHDLRRRIDDTPRSLIGSDGDGLLLHRTALALDVDAFEEAVGEGSPASLTRAAAIYTCDLLTGLKLGVESFDLWLSAERHRLRDLACQAMQRLAGLQLADGELDGALVSAQRAVDLDPACESAHRWLMRIYAERGDEAAAERQYRFCNAVLDREYGLAPEPETVRLRENIHERRREAVVQSPSPFLRRPSVAVDPFVCTDVQPDPLQFASDLAEDVATALHRWKGIDVLRPGPDGGSTALPLGHGVAANPSDGAPRDGHARYVLKGTVRKSGSRIRVMVQLVDRLTSSQVWADRYDRRVHDVVAVQDEITNRIVGAVEPGLRRHEADLSRRDRLDENNAHEHFLRGSWHLDRVNSADNEKAIELLRRAVRIDPGFLQASIGLARALLANWSYDWSKDLQSDCDELLRVVAAAIELDHSDPYCHYLTAAVSLLSRHHQDALAAAASAVELNPCFGLGHFLLGQVCLLAGWPEAAAEATNTGLRLDPRNAELPRWLTVLACAEYQLRRYDKAVLTSLAAVQRRASASSYLILAAGYGQLGHFADASTAFSRFRRIVPARLAPFEQPAFARFRDVRHIIEGLVRAGIRIGAEKPRRSGAGASPTWQVAPIRLVDGALDAPPSRWPFGARVADAGGIWPEPPQGLALRASFTPPEIPRG
ncbi:MAG: Adenylate cyclase [Rhodospirillales bacterium]|nr:Adenylate cyclase [Rhodospirillales bacterium]